MVSVLMFTFCGPLYPLPNRLSPRFLPKASKPNAVPAIPRPKPVPATPLLA